MCVLATAIRDLTRKQGLKSGRLFKQVSGFWGGWPTKAAYFPMEGIGQNQGNPIEQSSHCMG